MLTRTDDLEMQRLLVQLRRSRRAMLWAVAEKRPTKAAVHAVWAAHYGRRYLKRREQLGYGPPPVG